MNTSFNFYEFLIVGGLLVIVIAIAAPRLIEARKQRNELEAIGSLRSIASAEAIYVERSLSATYGRLSDLRDYSGLLDAELGTGTRNNYIFEVIPDSKTPEYAFQCFASPLDERSGNRYFFLDQSGVIRFSDSAFANAEAAYSAEGQLGARGK